MKTLDCVRIINQTVMSLESIPETKIISPSDEAKVMGWPDVYVTSCGLTIDGGWEVTTVIRHLRTSLSLEVILLSPHEGEYGFEILNEFLNEETLKAYAGHALIRAVCQSS